MGWDGMGWDARKDPRKEGKVKERFHAQPFQHYCTVLVHLSFLPSFLPSQPSSDKLNPVLVLYFD